MGWFKVCFAPLLVVTLLVPPLSVRSAVSDEEVARFEATVHEVYSLMVDFELAAQEQLEATEAGDMASETPLGLPAMAIDMEADSERLWSLGERLVAEASLLLGQWSDAELVDYLLQAEPLPLMSLVGQSLSVMAVEGELEQIASARDRFRQLVLEHPALEDRLLDLWWDERTFSDLLLGPEAAEARARLNASPDWLRFGTVGGQFGYTAVQLISPTRLQQRLSEATAPERLESLPQHVREMIELGHLAQFAELPAEWLAEQVDAGHLIWLNSLSIVAPEQAESALAEHATAIDRTQRLRLILHRPQPDDLIVAQDAWQSLMDAAWCDGCGEPVDPDMAEALVMALLSMEGEAPARMLRELLAEEALPNADMQRMNIGSMALWSEQPALQRLGLELAEESSSILLMAANFPGLHALAPERLHALAAQRLEDWDSLNRDEQAWFARSGLGCEPVAWAFYVQGSASDMDWKSRYRALMGQDEVNAFPGCAMALASIIRTEKDGLHRLSEVMAFYQSIEVGGDAWSALTSSLRRQGNDDHRLVLAGALLDSSHWDALSDADRRWLLGEEDRSSRPSSCRAEEPPED